MHLVYLLANKDKTHFLRDIKGRWKNEWNHVWVDKFLKRIGDAINFTTTNEKPWQDKERLCAVLLGAAIEGELWVGPAHTHGHTIT